MAINTSTVTATLVHAFVTARLDYCSTLYAGLLALRLGCLEWAIRTAARLIGGIPRTGHVYAYMHARCFSLVTSPAPDHISYLCCGLEVPSGPCSGLPPRSLLSHIGHQRLYFPLLNGTGVLFVNFACTSTRQTRAFLVIGPSVCNGFSLALQFLPRVHSDAFYSSLKTALFRRARVGSASE